MKVLGIDEAGRGPLIGPMIIAGVLIEDGEEAALGAVKDSKLLYHNKRKKLSQHIIEHFTYKVIRVEPKEIDAALESKTLNLNWLEAHKQAEIINEINPDVAIIDCPSPSISKYKAYLLDLLKNKKIKLIIEHKADVNYPVCSAASIVAKVVREEEMDKIKKKYGDTGPGYVTHPKTIEFLKKNWSKYPDLFRKSWSTYKNHVKSLNQKSLF